MSKCMSSDATIFPIFSSDLFSMILLSHICKCAEAVVLSAAGRTPKNQIGAD
jgi:hypothetical protein